MTSFRCQCKLFLAEQSFYGWTKGRLVECVQLIIVSRFTQPKKALEERDVVIISAEAFSGSSTKAYKKSSIT